MNEVITAEEASVGRAVQVSDNRDSRALVSIIGQAALDKDYPIERLQQLFELKKQWEAEEARKAFTAAMARFAAEAPTILKDHHVKYKNRDGSFTEYDHATLGHACEMIVPALGRVGIKHRWIPKQNGNEIEITCILTHELGHSESVSLHGPYDDSGGKNAIQAIKSAKTYLENATLFAATGLAPIFGDDDDDGRDAGDPTTATASSEEQLAWPDGYKAFRERIPEIAKKGTKELRKTWEATAEALRTYATAKDAKWWAGQKKTAETADAAALVKR